MGACSMRAKCSTGPVARLLSGDAHSHTPSTRSSRSAASCAATTSSGPTPGPGTPTSPSPPGSPLTASSRHTCVMRGALRYCGARPSCRCIVSISTASSPYAERTAHLCTHLSLASEKDDSRVASTGVLCTSSRCARHHCIPTLHAHSHVHRLKMQEPSIPWCCHANDALWRPAAARTLVPGTTTDACVGAARAGACLTPSSAAAAGGECAWCPGCCW
mmetsp:Transcript_21465/g.54663  ORF Transcript_21465/g.54663 Transcript_21465/m.54663 type:complete len:218 (+) Transcript_21465:731-1384(+)